MEFSLSDITLYTSFLCAGLFTWSFYKSSVFRRSIIETGFTTYDYCYDKFYKIWYDDKIRIKNINPNGVNVKELHDFILLNHNLEKKTINNLETIFENENENEIISSDKDKNENHNHKKLLLDFLSNDLYFQAITIKEKKYYLISFNTKFTYDNILEMPWLSVSLEIISDEDVNNSYDITHIFNKFWLDGNYLPIHLEYYYFWIDTLLYESGISKNNIISKEKIKQMNLVIINETGDFIEYNNVLIVPRKDDLKIIDFPLKDKT